MFIQDPMLGAAAIALYPVQGWLIPKLQRKVNQLGKQRVRTVRKLADRIGESVAGIAEIHANDTVRAGIWPISPTGSATIYDIRFEIFKRKFFIKFLNNFINQLTPFFFYSIGGYLVIEGSISFGALVAVLAAYKDLASPWKELLDFYQQKEDVRIKYEQVVEQFDPPELMPPADRWQEPIRRAAAGARSSCQQRLAGRRRAACRRSWTTSACTCRLDAACRDRRRPAAARTSCAMLLARLMLPTSGTHPARRP